MVVLVPGLPGASWLFLHGAIASIDSSVHGAWSLGSGSNVASDVRPMGHGTRWGGPCLAFDGCSEDRDGLCKSTSDI